VANILDAAKLKQDLEYLTQEVCIDTDLVQKVFQFRVSYRGLRKNFRRQDAGLSSARPLRPRCYTQPQSENQSSELPARQRRYSRNGEDRCDKPEDSAPHTRHGKDFGGNQITFEGLLGEINRVNFVSLKLSLAILATCRMSID
jgi:hypothetical protein